MPRKQYRKPKCACGARKVDGRCSAIPSCADYAKPAHSVRAAERGRRPEPVGYLTRAETAAAFDRLGLPALNPNPNADLDLRASGRVLRPF